jgi:hypothetical protein
LHNSIHRARHVHRDRLTPDKALLRSSSVDLDNIASANLHLAGNDDSATVTVAILVLFYETFFQFDVDELNSVELLEIIAQQKTPDESRHVKRTPNIVKEFSTRKKGNKKKSN